MGRGSGMPCTPSRLPGECGDEVGYTVGGREPGGAEWGVGVPVECESPDPAAPSFGSAHRDWAALQVPVPLRRPHAAHLHLGGQCPQEVVSCVGTLAGEQSIWGTLGPRLGHLSPHIAPRCATTHNYDRDRAWGYCVETTLPLQGTGGFGLGHPELQA